MSEAVLHELTVADTVAIQCALSVMTGALASGFWLRQAASSWGHTVARLSRYWLLGGALLALAGEAAAVWLQAAAMLDEPSTPIGPAMAMVLRETHFGRAGCVGTAALVAVCLAQSSVRWSTRPIARAVSMTALTAFVLSRSVVSHAASQGDLSWQVVVDAIHLACVALWVGIVLIGACVALGKSPGDFDDCADAARWIAALSRTATVVLAGVVVTGVLKVGWATSSVQLLVGSLYGRVFLVKLVLAGIAAALGGINRFRVTPALLRGLSTQHQSMTSLQGRFARIVRWEAAVLLSVVVVAAVLSGTPTPGEG